uniref:Uncharacterized protein n=1 Tax=Anguilla anguilla TaxID=7936 RepID=A0A0E9R4S6_ANGAN
MEDEGHGPLVEKTLAVEGLPRFISTMYKCRLSLKNNRSSRIAVIHRFSISGSSGQEFLLTE